MILSPELEQILLNDAIPIRMREESERKGEEAKKQGNLHVLDITGSFDQIVSQITRQDMLLTNYVVLLENPKNERWIALSLQKPHYLPGYSNCQVNMVRSSGKGEKLYEYSGEMGVRIPEERWNGDEKTPALPSPISLAMALYEEAKSRIQRGYNITYTSVENARASKSYTFPENAFPKTKLKDDPKFHQAVEEFAAYLQSVKNDFDGKELHLISIEYTLEDWRYGSTSNPWKSVVQEALKKVSFVQKYNDIDPHGSGDGGTLVFEVAPLNDRETIELSYRGMDAKPTGQLDEKKFRSDVSSMGLDGVIHFT